MDNIDPTVVVQYGALLDSKESIAMHIYDQRCWGRKMPSGLFQKKQRENLHEIGNFALCIVLEGMNVYA